MSPINQTLYLSVDTPEIILALFFFSPVHPMDISSPNVMAAGGPPIMTPQMATGTPSQPPNYIQYPPQTQQQHFNAAVNMIAMQQQQQANQVQ